MPPGGDVRPDDVDLNEVAQRRVDELLAAPPSADVRVCSSSRLLDYGVADADVRRRRQGPLFEAEVEKRDVDRLTGLDFNLPRALGRTARVSCRVSFLRHYRRNAASRLSHLRYPRLDAHLTCSTLHCNNQRHNKMTTSMYTNSMMMSPTWSIVCLSQYNLYVNIFKILCVCSCQPA